MNTHILVRGRFNRRRAIIAVQVAVLLVVLLGFAALTVDVGALYNTKADLQRTADASALAAAARLSEYGGGDPVVVARAAALEYTQLNRVLGQEMTLDPADVVFGRAIYDEGTGRYDFTPTEVLPDAVRIQVRHTAASTNGAVPLYFARIFGLHDTDMSASAIAVMVPRDIAIVADLSASHNDDSELKSYKLTDINLLDVWAGVPVDRGVNGVGDGVNSPPPGDAANPAAPPTFGPGHAGNGGVDPGTAPLGGQRGPTFGRMYYWGDSLARDMNYDPVTDPALMNLPRYQKWNDSDLVAMYQNSGYSSGEITALMSDTYDSKSGSSQHWSNRVAVALGLARWNSGQPGGLWESLPPGSALPGNGNGWVGGGEMTWLVDYPFDSGSWGDYIYNYVGKSWTAMASANANFRYRFGLKTFFNYALERRSSNSQTPDIANTPHQPMQAVKDAVDFMVSYIDSLETDDLLSLEIYGTVARHEVDLTYDHSQVSTRLGEMQAGHYDGWTNMGGGIEKAIEELGSIRARGTSVKMVILLTDGNANVTAGGQTGDYPGGAAYALEQAQLAADEGLRIFAVSVGTGANQSLMSQIADIGQGEHFHAEGSIEQYSAELEQIFRRLGGTRPVELIQ